LDSTNTDSFNDDDDITDNTFVDALEDLDDDDEEDNNINSLPAPPPHETDSYVPTDVSEREDSFEDTMEEEETYSDASESPQTEDTEEMDSLADEDEEEENLFSDVSYDDLVLDATPTMNAWAQHTTTTGEILILIPSDSEYVAYPHAFSALPSLAPHNAKDIPTPKTVNQAKKSPEWPFWYASMQAEMSALSERSVFRYAHAPQHANVTKSKWVFRKKYDTSGKVRYKARLVAKGFTQQYGVDFFETFAPVIRFDTLRFIIAFALFYGLMLNLADVVTAYLHGLMDTIVFMHQPELFNDGTGRVLVLTRSLYGTKQAGRQWYIALRETLIKEGYQPTEADPCLFLRVQDKILLCIYVDDLFFFGTQEAITMAQQALEKHYKLDKHTTLTLGLGIEFTSLPNGSLILHQKRYVQSLLDKFGSHGTIHPVTIPMKTDVKPLPLLPNTPPTNKPFLSLVASLLFLATCTRPDISFAVSVVCRYMHNPGEEHWNLAWQIFLYVLSTNDYGLQFLADSANSTLTGYVDAGFLSDIHDSKSQCGWSFHFGSTAICWSSKKLSRVTLSPTETEYATLSEGARHALWIYKLAKDVHLPHTPITIFIDNKGAIDLAKNPVHHDRTKHLRKEDHFIRECLHLNLFQVHKIATQSNIADIFTKPLSRLPFELHRFNLGIRSLSQELNATRQVTTVSSAYHRRQGGMLDASAASATRFSSFGLVPTRSRSFHPYPPTLRLTHQFPQNTFPTGFELLTSTLPQTCQSHPVTLVTKRQTYRSPWNPSSENFPDKPR
jgi:Reverse transcriptase (RNA-dependent DNA polymerase)